MRDKKTSDITHESLRVGRLGSMVAYSETVSQLADQ